MILASCHVAGLEPLAHTVFDAVLSHHLTHLTKLGGGRGNRTLLDIRLARPYRSPLLPPILKHTINFLVGEAPLAGLPPPATQRVMRFNIGSASGDRTQLTID